MSKTIAITKKQKSLLEDFKLFYESIPAPAYLQSATKLAKTAPISTKRLSRKRK